MTLLIQPVYTDLQDVTQQLRAHGYAALKPADVFALSECRPTELSAVKSFWSDLPADPYLMDGGHYRRRRHSCFILENGTLEQAPHRAHYQPLEYNALHGGMQRMFEPIRQEVAQSPILRRLMASIRDICTQVRPVQRWYVEAHQFRIDTTGGIGRPTPEGAHRDGVDFVAILLVDRVSIKGGESRIFEADSPYGRRFTLSDAWSLLILDDRRVIHETTPIQPTAEGGYRDTLVFTFRIGGFLEAK